MDGTRLRFALLVALGLFPLCGASCHNMMRPFGQPTVRVLAPTATLEQVVDVVNRNSAGIHAFSSTEASISSPGMPTLRANLAFSRPQRFRLRAQTAMTGAEVDLGSNDELFWFWIRRSEPPAVYYCRHAQFATSAARQSIPIEPGWLVEALGVVEFDPSLPHQGPYPLPGDRFEVRTVRETPQGPMTKSTVIDAARGWVVEQHLYNAAGQRVASAVAEQHRRDPLTNLVMPRVVNIESPLAQFSMRVNLGNVQINRLAGNPAELWSMPRYPGAALVDIGAPASPSGPGYPQPGMLETPPAQAGYPQPDMLNTPPRQAGW
ncbi:MAG: hypothetical protein U1E05_09060 [Patescibacteria group bacterium]|nr:hypothetical protein [Patescibacteria group bacterium]